MRTTRAARWAAAHGAQSRRRQRARVTAEGAPSCVIRTKYRRACAIADTAVTTDRREGRCHVSSTRARSSHRRPRAVRVATGCAARDLRLAVYIDRVVVLPTVQSVGPVGKTGHHLAIPA